MEIDLEETFKEVAIQMQSKFRQAQKTIQHSGFKGQVNERIVCNYLKDYLPKSLDISTGELVDRYGGRSRQIDVIISDTFKTPIFLKDEEIRVIPVECAYSVIEVKAHLDLNELDKAFTNMKSVRSLRKTAYFQSRLPENGYFLHYGMNSPIWPINYFVFAFDSINLDDLREAIEQRHKAEQLPLWSRIDTICILNKGIITNLKKKSISEHLFTSKQYDVFRTLPEAASNSTFDYLDTLPEQGTELHTIHTEKSLLLFHMLISKHLHEATMPNFNITLYLPFFRP